jgi:hypothetical protein
MGHGLDPAPTNDLGTGIVIDDGTSPRTEVGTPGPVGLDSSGGSSNKSSASIAQEVMAFITQRMGTRHGDGECYTLADDALKKAGAKSAADYGKITEDADYVWGTAVKLTEVKAGDFVQFRNYRYERTIKTTNPDGSWSEKDDKKGRPHHTAIVEQVNGDGSLVVLEQNAPKGDPVARNTLFFKSGTTESDNTKTTVKVTGTFRFYRPQAR